MKNFEAWFKKFTKNNPSVDPIADLELIKTCYLAGAKSMYKEFESEYEKSCDFDYCLYILNKEFNK